VFEDLDAVGYRVITLPPDVTDVASVYPSRYVSGARVTLIDQTQGKEISTVTSSSAHGTFDFVDLPPGKYTLQVQTPSYFKFSPIPSKFVCPVDFVVKSVF